MNFPEKYAVHALPRYRSVDGQLHETKAEAETANRRAALGDILTVLTQQNPEFAKLDGKLFVDACMAQGRAIGEAAVRPLDIVGDSDDSAGVMVRVPETAKPEPASMLRPATAASRVGGDVANHTVNARPIRAVDPRAKPEADVENEIAAAMSREFKPRGFA